MILDAFLGALFGGMIGSALMTYWQRRREW
jgi:hypothetical protein